MTNIQKRIEDKLKNELNVSHLEIADESHKHHGHSGYREGGQTHFKILVISDIFADMSKITRHRKIYEILDAELKERVHALAINAYTPDEYNTIFQIKSDK